MKASKIGAAMAAATLCAATWAQTYPSRPVTLVVGFPPGGGADAVARIVAERMARSLGQPVLVDNKPGAGTTLASDFVARAPADGYTVMLGGANLYGSDQMLYKSAKYDGEKSFTPIARLTSAPMMLAVKKDFPAKNVKELVTQARGQPDKFTYSSSGAGVVTHIAGLAFSQASNIKMLHVPFKGGAPSIQAVAAGDVDMTFGTPPSILPMAQSGKLRVLAVTSAERSPFFPDVPGMKESGVPNYDFTFWFGLYGPAGLPAPVQKRLFDAVTETLSDPDVKTRLEKQGNAAAPSKSIEEFRAWAAREGKLSREMTSHSGAGLQ